MAAPKGVVYNVDGLGGRPRRYTDEYVNELAEKLDKWTEIEDNVFIEGFCYEHRIPEETISTELIKNDKFSKAYNRLKTKQKLDLFKGGLNRKHAHPMCALILSHNHNIVAKTEQKLTGSAVDPLTMLLGDIDGKSKGLVDDSK